MHSEKTKEKMRLSHLGKIGWWRGKKFSKEHRDGISNSCKGKKKPGMEKNLGIHSLKGNKISLQQRLRMSQSRKKGSESVFWKGGITPLNLKIRSSLEFRQWRSDIFTRDKFTCQWCGDSRGGNLNADHIRPLSILLQEYEITDYEQARKCEALWNLNNGRTLCIDCHKKTETYGMRKKSIQLEML